MTLSDRNNAFRLGIAFSILCLAICIAASFKAIPAYAVMEDEINRRPEGILQVLFSQFSNVQLLAAHWCIVGMVLYSVLSVIFIHYSFEKTQSPEIMYIVLFAASFSFEALRLVLPLMWVYEIPSLYLLMASRLIVFGRYLGIFSLFSASVFAVGLKVQKQRNVIMVITIITLIIALGFPIDTQIWDSSLNMINGYVSTLRLIELGAVFITIISFFVAAWLRSSQEFTFISIGVAFAFLGRAFLLTADTWAGLPIGLPLLVIGTWLICTRLHKIYLWL